MIGRSRRGGHVLPTGGFRPGARRGREPGGDGAAPLRDLRRRRRTHVVTFRRQDRQVINGDDPTGRGTIVQATRDRREVAFEQREALIRRFGVPSSVTRARKR